jgi:hypothetical protein
VDRLKVNFGLTSVLRTRPRQQAAAAAAAPSVDLKCSNCEGERISECRGDTAHHPFGSCESMHSEVASASSATLRPLFVGVLMPDYLTDLLACCDVRSAISEIG